MATRAYRNATQWQQLIDLWRTSELSITEFCQTHQLSTMSFTNGGNVWQRKLSIFKPTRTLSLLIYPLLQIKVVPAGISSCRWVMALNFPLASNNVYSCGSPKNLAVYHGCGYA
ncbi:hypothetical protein ORJ04_18030 [Rheinheimera baltica]|uniref:Mobile element protein n=1 Tax=Rheinheimera baltica TaxID=67576 RepID=A0ABT9I394_9GAMM|nr:hypothetical protein [Rheinheimera baltica]MDP5137855.1 hypothetical protein [Rheinheimera baltica]